MMTEHNSSATPRWVKKLLIPALIGGVAGFAASAGVLRFIDSPAIGGLSESATIAALVGMLYTLIGLGVWFGTASPQVGAKFLNVEDADELREQKKVLILSGIVSALWGVSLMALAFAAPEGPLPQGIALAVGLGGLLIGSVISVAVYRACDELMRAVNLEAGALSYGALLAIVGLWALLAHLGYTAGPAPLDLLSLFYAVPLIASFVVIGRRGMMTAR